MPTIRIAVASTPLTAILDEAVPAAVAAISEAGRLNAKVVCLPETVLPGHRLQSRPVPDFTHAELDGAVAEIAKAVAAAGVVTILSVEKPTPAGREIVAVVIDGDGTIIGEQPKTQIDPSEEPLYVPGSGRRTFTAAGLTFAVATCHEAFRYPELSRLAALSGAQVIFVPHYVTADLLPTQWCAAENPYNEKALMLRAIENTIFVAPANNGGSEQGSASCIIAPDGTLISQVPYGEIGIATADIDLDLATGLIARRWSPERNQLALFGRQ